MFRALIKQVDGEGNQHYACPPGDEALTHHAPEQAAEYLLHHYGPNSGMITTLEGNYVTHV